MIPLAIVCIGLLAFLYVRETAHDKERQILLNRIQAPATAVAMSLPDDDKNPPERSYLQYDDDAEYHKEMERLNDGGN